MLGFDEHIVCTVSHSIVHWPRVIYCQLRWSIAGRLWLHIEELLSEDTSTSAQDTGTTALSSNTFIRSVEAEAVGSEMSTLDATQVMDFPSSFDSAAEDGGFAQLFVNTFGPAHEGVERW